MYEKKTLNMPVWEKKSLIWRVNKNNPLRDKGGAVSVGEPPAFGVFSLSEAFTIRLVSMLRNASQRNKFPLFTKLAGYFLFARLGNSPVDLVRDSVRFRVHVYDNYSDREMLLAKHSFDEIEDRLIQFSHQLKGAFVDIGATSGRLSLLASRHGGFEEIISIEPLPVLYERLCFNVFANECKPIKSICVAVADFTGELKLFVENDDLSRAGLQINGSTQREVVVPCDTIISLLSRETFHKVQALNMDTGGTEVIALVPFLVSATNEELPRLIVIPTRRIDAKLRGCLVKRGFRIDSQNLYRTLWKRDMGCDSDVVL